LRAVVEFVKPAPLHCPPGLEPQGRTPRKKAGLHCPSWARTRTLLIQSPPAGATFPDNLLGIGHFPSIGARFPAVVCPLVPGETTARLRQCSWRAVGGGHARLPITYEEPPRAIPSASIALIAWPRLVAGSRFSAKAPARPLCSTHRRADAPVCTRVSVLASARTPSVSQCSAANPLGRVAVYATASR
jgi:hypothetical protein